MKILEALLPIIFLLIKLLILSVCFGFFARIIKTIFIRQSRQVDKIFAYLYTAIFYIPFIFKGTNFLIKNLKIFFYDITFLQKILWYVIPIIIMIAVTFSLLKIFIMMLNLFFICSKSEEEEAYHTIAAFLTIGIQFVISAIVITSTFSFFIGGILKPLFGHGGLILKIFISFIFLVCLSAGIIFIAGIIKRLHKGKKKFLMKSIFLDKNNKKGFFKFIVRFSEKENKIFIHYQEHMSERKMGIDFYVDKETIEEVFYGTTDTTFSTAFFEKNKRLEDNKILKLKFSIPQENLIAFYYRDKYKTYKNKESLSYSYIKLDYHPCLFLTNLTNNCRKIDLQFSYLEINNQNLFIEEYGEIRKLTRSFKNLNEFFSNYFIY